MNLNGTFLSFQPEQRCTACPLPCLLFLGPGRVVLGVNRDGIAPSHPEDALAPRQRSGGLGDTNGGQL